MSSSLSELVETTAGPDPGNMVLGGVRPQCRHCSSRLRPQRGGSTMFTWHIKMFIHAVLTKKSLDNIVPVYLILK